uniref:Uncharacterized protein n=1 Tax=Cannabis sativa TaxID=3483 RepID=A0A803PL48_CANSA
MFSALAPIRASLFVRNEEPCSRNCSIKSKPEFRRLCLESSRERSIGDLSSTLVVLDISIQVSWRGRSDLIVLALLGFFFKQLASENALNNFLLLEDQFPSTRVFLFKFKQDAIVAKEAHFVCKE